MNESTLCPLCGTTNEAGQQTCRNCQGNLQQAALIQTLSERVSVLEETLAQLQSRAPAALNLATPAEPSPAAKPAQAKPQKSPTRLPENVWQSDFWLNKIGLGLLLLALAFLFNYAVEQGWLTPAVRLTIGLVLGTGLLVLGYRIYEGRRHFGQVLLGGGIAAYYITGFAAFQLYELVSYPLAFGFMILVTGLALLLSLRQHEAMLSLIGGLGGLVTPFLLYTGEGNVIELVIYTCLVGSGLVAIYFYKGWQSVLWLATTGGWLIMLIVMFSADLIEERTISAENTVLQGGILFCLLLFWAVPVLRRLDWLEAPDRLPRASLGLADSIWPASVQAFFDKHLRLAMVGNPLAAMGMTWGLWRLSEMNEGLLSLTVVVIFGFISWQISQREVREDLAYGHGVTAVLFLTIAISQIFNDDWHMLLWMVEAAVLHGLSGQIQRRTLPLAAHSFSLLIVLGLLARLFDFGVGTAVFNQPALIDLAIIGLLLGASYLLPPNTPAWLRQAYRLLAHISVLIWLWREFSFPPEGQGLVTVAWGVYAVGLLAVALRYQIKQLRLVALGTLFLLVGKLFLVDLTAVETVWRILLFAGFGGLFLFISYFYRSWLGLSEGIN